VEVVTVVGGTIAAVHGMQLGRVVESGGGGCGVDGRE
jgi:hypothetical protein